MSKAKNVAEVLATAMPAGGSMDVPLKLIVVDDKFNVRQSRDEDAIKELAKSLDHEGQINDITVEPNGDGSYTLRAGYRRFTAAKLLEWDSIRATVWIPRDDKGNPLTDEKDKAIARYFLNMAENVARANVTPYDLAMRCRLMSDSYELKGEQIGKRLGKNTGYINNLLAIVGGGKKGEHAGNTLTPEILARWKEECSWPEDDTRTKICRINDLRRWVRLSHEDQLKEFNEEMFVAGGGDREEYRKQLKEQANGTSAAGAGAGAGEPGAVRATRMQLETAIEAAKTVKRESRNKEEITRYNGIIDGLEFALGVKKGLANRIKGVIAYKDGECIEDPFPVPEDKTKGKDGKRVNA